MAEQTANAGRLMHPSPAPTPRPSLTRSRPARCARASWLLVAVLTASLATSAKASQGEHSFSAAPRYVALLGGDGGEGDLHGVGVSGGYRYGLSDFFTLTVDATYGLLLAGEATREDTVEHLGLVRVGATYTIDAVTWVPWFGASAGAYFSSLGQPVDGGLAVGAGLDYRRWRHFSVGADAWYHALFGQLDKIPATLTVGLRFTWYLER